MFNKSWISVPCFARCENLETYSVAWVRRLASERLERIGNLPVFASVARYR